MSQRQRPDRFDGDTHPGADGDLCPLCGYMAPPGEHRGHPRTCSSCGGEWAAPSGSSQPWQSDRRDGAVTWS